MTSHPSDIRLKVVDSPVFDDKACSEFPCSEQGQTQNGNPLESSHPASLWKYSNPKQQCCFGQTTEENSHITKIVKFLQAPRSLTDGFHPYNEPSFQSKLYGNCEENQNRGPGVATNKVVICDQNRIFQEYESETTPNMTNINYKVDFDQLIEAWEELDGIIQNEEDGVLKQSAMQSGGFLCDNTFPQEPIHMKNVEQPPSQDISVNQLTESQSKTIPDAEYKAFFSVDVDGKSLKSVTCDEQYDTEKIKKSVIRPRIPIPYDQNKEKPFETLGSKSKLVEQQQVFPSSQIESGPQENVENFSNVVPDPPVMQTLPPATIPISATQTMPEPTVSGLPNLFTTSANPCFHQPQAPIVQLSNKMTTRPADLRSSGTCEWFPQPQAPIAQLSSKTTVFPANLRGSDSYGWFPQPQVPIAQLSNKTITCPANLQGSGTYECIAQSHPPLNSMPFPFHQPPAQTCNQQVTVPMTANFQGFTQASRIEAQADESFPLQHAFDKIIPKAVSRQAQPFPLHVNTQTYSHSTQTSALTIQKRKATSLGMMNSGKKSRTIAQAQDKAPDGASLREKSFTSGLYSTNFLKSYHRMKNPFVNSGFFLHRIDRIKCCNTGCELEHMIPGVFRKEAKSVQWHNPECQFFAARIPCYNCVAWNGKCRGCKMCQRDDL